MEFDVKGVVVTAVFWVITLVALWGYSTWGKFEMVLISVLTLPLYYFAVMYQINKG